MYGHIFLLGCLSLLVSAVLGNPECPNTIAFYNPNLRTMCSNSTWFILPVPKADAESLVKLSGYSLITPDFSDKTLFPTGFPAGAHPVVVSSGYNNDIRMFFLGITALSSAAIYVPYTDRLKDGKTPFNYPVQNFIAGVNGQTIMGLVPALVGSAVGTNIFVAQFAPTDDAYAPIDNSPNEFSTRVQQVIVPEPLSGPGIVPEAYDFDFVSTKNPLYTDHTFHALLNQPLILTNDFCQRNTYYFNETFTNPTMRSGNVTLFGPTSGAAPKVLAKKYIKQGGFSASAELVGYNPEECKVASSRVDPYALQ
ncbi:MAG: hypothetical protein LQ350_004070 [Teloschistes chrysophthalmus]|nr:MAG: hypothetical protein LQ350_004070 [Niorma chrysophthalma]